MEVGVYDVTDTLLDVVLDAIDPQFQEQLNAPGSFSFGLQVDSKTLARTPTLLDYSSIAGNFVRLKDSKSGHVFAGLIEGKQRKTVGDRASQVWQVSGRGYLAGLQDAIVYPEYGLVRFRGDSRPFNFASLDGSWRVASEWAEPLFGPWGSADVGWRKGSPKDWPDPQGEWMWPSPGPTDLNRPESTAYFRRQFTTDTTAMYRFYCTGDNEFDLWVNGEMVLSGNDWGTTYSVDVWVPAGNTLVAIEGRNWPQLPATTSTAGVLFAMYTIAGDGTTGSIQRRSTSGAGWIARMDNGTPPGWNPGLVLSTLVAEAQNTARGGGVASLAPVTVSWTDTEDTDGVAWSTASPSVVTRTFPIADDLLDVATQLAELGVDIRVNGSTLALEMRLMQGTDRTVDPGAVVLHPAGSLVDADYQGDASGQRNVLLVQGADGQWYERAVIPSPPRREAGLQVGNATSQQQIDLVVDQTLAQYGTTAAEQFTATVTDKGPVPFVDFTVGDDVLIPDPAGGLSSQRVVSLTVRQQDRTVLYTPELSSIIKSWNQRQAQALRSQGLSSLGGRVANASPVQVSTRVQAATAGAASGSKILSPASFIQVITDATVTSYTLPQTPVFVTRLMLNGLEQRSDGWSVSGATVDVTSLKRVAGDTLQVDYEV